MKLDFSIVITTYNRINLLKNLLKNIEKELSGLNYEIIISDNASTDNTEDFFNKNINKRIKYYRNKQNIGFYKNFLNGLEKATCDIVWLCSDDDDIGEKSFFEEGIEILKQNKADLVFGRLQTKASRESKADIVDMYPFKSTYTKEEYLKDWINIRERISSACFLYRRQLFIDAHLNFIDLPFYGGTIDYALHYYIIKHCNKIQFLDKVSYIWTISQNEKSISGQSRDDLMWQMMNIFAFPLAYFDENKNYDKEFFNNYIIYGVNALLSSYYVAKNDIYFKETLDYILKNNLDKVYIFGRGEVGLALKYFLTQNNILVVSFIDDNVNSEDTISFEKFEEYFNKDEKKTIILSTYKATVERLMLKKINKIRTPNLNIISIVDIALESK